MSEEQKRVVPLNDLDFNFMTTEPVWGTPEVSSEIRERLEQHFLEKGKDGKMSVVTKGSLWGLLGSYTRDMRLANLSYVLGEMQYCQKYLDLANDFLQADMIRAFLLSLSRVATVLELSQSKGGFLRKRMGTFTQEKREFREEPKRNKLIGGKNHE